MLLASYAIATLLLLASCDVARDHNKNKKGVGGEK
jgi:hypothetical protein